MRRRQSRPEDAIQRAVFLHIATRGAPGLFAFHVPNGGKRRPIEAAILKGLGVVAGVPDVILIHADAVYALELKDKDGSTTPVQRLTITRMERAGARVAVAYGLDAAIHQLEAWGLLRGVAA